MSDSSLSNHPMAFSITPDGTHNGGIEFNEATTLTTPGGFPQGYSIRSSSAAPGTAGAFIQFHYSESMDSSIINDKLYYYDKNNAGAGGIVNVGPDDFTEVNVTDLVKKVYIGTADTLKTPSAANSTVLTWSNAVTYTDSTINQSNADETSLILESDLTSTDATISPGQIFLNDVDIPESKVKSQGIPNSSFTVNYPIYSAQYEGEIHGGILAQQGGTKGYRQLSQKIQLVRTDNDVVIAESIMRTQIVYGAKDCVPYYQGVDGGIQSVLPDTEIMLPDGSVKLAKDIKVGDSVLSWDDTNKKLDTGTIFKVHSRSVSEYYEVHVGDKKVEV